VIGLTFLLESFLASHQEQDALLCFLNVLCSASESHTLKFQVIDTSLPTQLKNRKLGLMLHLLLNDGWLWITHWNILHNVPSNKNDAVIKINQCFIRKTPMAELWVAAAGLDRRDEGLLP